MQVLRSRSAPLIGVVAALFLMAGVAAAASAGFSAASVIGSGNKAVTSPCSSVAASIVPSYSTSGYYEVASVDAVMACGVGGYELRVTLGTGPGTYMERTSTVTFLAQGSQTVSVYFPSGVKVADVTNIAALVVPATP